MSAASIWYVGARANWSAGDVIAPRDAAAGAHEAAAPFVAFTDNLDAAIWAAELAEGELEPRVYRVEPTGATDVDASLTDRVMPYPTMTRRSYGPLRVLGEVTTWEYYHGTKAQLAPGEFLSPGHRPNFGDRDRVTPHVYFSRTMDAAMWGAELADGTAPGRIYVVEPTGPFEEDPNLTNKKFRGNPTKSYRSRAPLRVVREVMGWEGHPPAQVQAMLDGLAKLRQQGAELIDD